MLRHDPLLARGLALEIGRLLGGRRAGSLHLARERRAAELRFGHGPSLLFLLHPEDGAILASEPALPGEGTRFRKLFLGEVRTPPDERLLLLSLVDGRGRERHRIAVELHTNQWNLLLLDVPPAGAGRGGAAAATGEGVEVRAALWPRRTAHRRLEAGAPYELPPGGRAWAGAAPSWGAWHRLLAPVAPGRRRGIALRGAAWLSSVNVDHVLGDAAEAEGEEELRAAYDRYLRLRRAAGVADDGGGGSRGAAGDAEAPGHAREASAWLLERSWGPQPYPVSLDEPGARRLPSLLGAMEAAAGGREALDGRLRELATAGAPAPDAGGRKGDAGRDEALRLRRALLAERKRLRGRRGALERELQRGADPEELRAIANLLLARIREVPRRAERATLEGFDGADREIELDPSLEPAENAEAYFREAARRERACERIPEEIARAEARIRAIEDGLEALEAALGRSGAEGPEATPARAGRPEPDAGREGGLAGLEEERLQSLWELAGGRPDPDAPAGAGGERLPYLRYRSSGGLEIRVGRSARGNDALTFHHSSPEDVWLHARQVQGAHVILRWGRREENPPRRDLLEAAVAAAVHSGARHSGTVAVDWTRRKYVRKPRKAPPGAVLPERVETLFVEPDEKLIEGKKLEG